MPESVFDYGAINAQMKGDDWYAPKRDMIDAARNYDRCVQNDCCEQQREPTPDEFLKQGGIPCTAPTPPIPCGQPAAAPPRSQQGLLPRGPEVGQQLRLKNVPPPGVIGEYKGVTIREVEDLKAQNLKLVDNAVAQLQRNPELISDDPGRACEALIRLIEQNICEETQKLHERVARLRSMVWRSPREENERIKEEEARYQLVTAPMRRQRDWMLQQFVQFTAPIPPPIHVAPYNDYAAEEVREVDMRTHKRGAKR